MEDMKCLSALASLLTFTMRAPAGTSEVQHIPVGGQAVVSGKRISMAWWHLSSWMVGWKQWQANVSPSSSVACRLSPPGPPTVIKNGRAVKPSTTKRSSGYHVMFSFKQSPDGAFRKKQKNIMLPFPCSHTLLFCLNTNLCFKLMLRDLPPTEWLCLSRGFGCSSCSCSLPSGALVRSLSFCFLFELIIWLSNTLYDAKWWVLYYLYLGRPASTWWRVL